MFALKHTPGIITFTIKNQGYNVDLNLTITHKNNHSSFLTGKLTLKNLQVLLRIFVRFNVLHDLYDLYR